MIERMSDLPQAETADPDGVQVALRAAQALWSRGDRSESLRWLRRAAESASDEGADMRSLQLAKAAAELRAKLFGSSEATAVATNEAGMHVAAEASSPGSVAEASPPPAPAGALPQASDESHPSSRPPGATQYVVHRPREAPRQLMGLSSTTLENAVQRDSSVHPPVSSWSADAERRVSAAPPPLPSAAVDDYEELDAEPEDDEAEPAADVAPWAPPTWRGQDVGSAPHREASAVSADGVSPGTAATPPPLPRSPFAFDDDDEDEDEDDPMRAEQPTVVIPPIEERRADARPPSGTSTPRGAATDSSKDASRSWDAEPPSSGWLGSESALHASLSGSSWEPAGDSAPSVTADPERRAGPASEPPPGKLTARVHHQAVRVALASDPRSAGQFVVRALREGERPAAGERVALLVALEPGQPLV